ncbi:MAG: hypothetical protein QW793_06175 [Candidatus Caldarchaeum sp.]
MRKRRRQDRWKNTERDAKIVELMLRGLSLEEIAQQVGLHRNTIWKKLKSARMQGLLDEARREVFRHTGYSVVASFNEAIAYLRKVIAGEVEADPVRVRAAHSLLTHNAFQALALEDVRREIEKLRDMLAKGNYGHSALAQSRENGEPAQAVGGLVIDEAGNRS